MGNTRSAYDEKSEFDDIWWRNDAHPTKTTTTPINNENSFNSESRPAANDSDKKATCCATVTSATFSSKAAEPESLSEFKMELDRKHEKRREIIAEKRREFEALRNEVMTLRKENEELKQKKPNNDVKSEDTNDDVERLRRENEQFRTKISEMEEELAIKDSLCEKNRELKISIAVMQGELQNLNGVAVNFEKEKADYEAHVVALKDVIKVSKQMLLIREAQLNELKQKVEEIEKSLARREIEVISQDLREEYERQLQNIRNLRSLYDERQRADRVEKVRLHSVLEAVKEELEHQKKTNTDNQQKIETLEKENSDKYYEIKNLESNLGLSKAESRQYQGELTVINQLFSQILISFNNNQEVDLDKLIKLLEENHDLLQNIAVNEVSSQASSALPKVLLDLVNRIHDDENANKEQPQTDPCCDTVNQTATKLETIAEESESQTSSVHQLNSPEEIVENLPKVWRVLIELLSHQCTPVNNISEDANDSGNPCYKLVDTPKGPNLVLSVSQTFIRLKDLILEKKSLEKDLHHLQQLNTHLETRLQDQGKRLEMVSSELSKTWHVVGKLQKQHQVLHTQEQILRYELAQKRKLLNTLKEELESSREKWLEAREKNSKTEKQWKQLRTEFASRKVVKCDYNNSVESGFSDERECSSSDDEPGYETDISESNPLRSTTDDSNDAELSDNSKETLDEQDNSRCTAEGPDGAVCIIENSVPGEGENLDVNLPQRSADAASEDSESLQIQKMTNLDESACHSNEPFKTESVQNERDDDATCQEDNVQTDGGKLSSAEEPDVNSACCTNDIGPKAPSDDPHSVTEIGSSNGEHISNGILSATEIGSTNGEYISNDVPSATEIGSTNGEHISNDGPSVTEIGSTNGEHISNDAPSVTEIGSTNGENISTQSDQHISTQSDQPISTQSDMHISTQADQESVAGTSAEAHSDGADLVPQLEKPVRTLEEVLAAREERLRRMEGQCQQLVSQVTGTSQRSVAICNRLEDLHEVYGENASASQTQAGSESSVQGENLDSNNRPSENQE